MNEASTPVTWVSASLDNVVDKIVGGGTPSKSNSSYYTGKIPWMSVKDMKKNILLDTVDHITQEAVDNSSTNIIPAGVPIIATRMSLGKIVIGKFDSAINQDLKAIFINEHVDSDYFVYWYRSLGQLIESLGTGTTVKGIRLEVLKELRFLLPSLAEQKQIATKLDELLAQVDTIKTRLDAIPTILKRFRQSVLAAAVSGKLTEEWRGENEFSTVKKLSDKCFDERRNLIKKRLNKPVELSEVPDVELPFSWLWNSIDQCAIKITDGTHHSPKSHVSGDFMYVTSKNVRAGFIDLSNITFIDKATHNEIYARCDVVQGDVLYVKDGANTGLACVNNIEEEISLLSSVGVIRPCSYINAKYMELYLNSPIGRKLMLEMMGGTAIPRLTLTKIKNAPISVPSIEEQTEIVQQVEIFFTFADQIEKQVSSAQTRVNNLTQSILAKAFRGDLTDEWREQNPTLISGENSAEALLKKIKAEQEALKIRKPKRSRGKKTRDVSCQELPA